MSEVKNPEVLDVAMESLENEETAQVNYSEKSLAELADLFMELARNPERMKMNKEAEAIKSAFYKNLAKEKAAAGLAVPEGQAAGADETVQDTEETEARDESVSENPFAEIERGFKALYNAYRKERAEYNREQEKERENNLALKEAVIKRIYPCPQLVDILPVFTAVGILPSYDKALQHPAELFGSQLLRRIAQCTGRPAMGLYHQAIESEVKRALRNFPDVFPVAAEMTRVTEERHSREHAFKLDCQSPVRTVPVRNPFKRREAPVYGPEFPDTGLGKPLYGTDPEIHVRSGRILDEYRNINTL